MSPAQQTWASTPEPHPKCSYHLDGVDVLANGPHVRVNSDASGVDFLGVDAVHGVKVLNLSVGEHPVEARRDLELGAHLSGERQALLLLGELQQVGALAHDGGTAGGHLEDLLLGCLPGDDLSQGDEGFIAHKMGNLLFTRKLFEPLLLLNPCPPTTLSCSPTHVELLDLKASIELKRSEPEQRISKLL